MRASTTRTPTTRSRDRFATGAVIEAAGTRYYIDAMNLPGNCNRDVALVYVANRVECVDGTPWVRTMNCGFGGVLTSTLRTGDSWRLLAPTVLFQKAVTKDAGIA